MHLIAVPESEDGLRRAIGEAHWRYTRKVDFCGGWKGHLWQGRFASFLMDESYLFAAIRYVELNPVRAGLVETPDAYPWSSASGHLSGQDNSLVRSPLRCIAGRGKDILCGNGEPFQGTSGSVLRKQQVSKSADSKIE